MGVNVDILAVGFDGEPPPTRPQSRACESDSETVNGYRMN